MAKKKTNKAKFSLYLDKDLMGKVNQRAKEIDRSPNYVLEKILEKEFTW